MLTQCRLRQPGHKYSFGEPNALSGPAGAELRNQKLQTLPRSKNRAGMQGKGGVSVQSAPTKAAPVAQDQPPSLASLFPGSFPVSTSNAATPTSASDTASGSMSNTPASPFAFGSTGAPNNTNTTGPYVFKSGTTAVRFDSGNTGTLGDSTAKAQSANGTGRTLNMNSAMPKANTAAKVNTAAGQTNGFGLKSANGQTTGQNILTNGTESSQVGAITHHIRSSIDHD